MKLSGPKLAMLIIFCQMPSGAATYPARQKGLGTSYNPSSSQLSASRRPRWPPPHRLISFLARDPISHLAPSSSRTLLLASRRRRRPPPPRPISLLEPFSSRQGRDPSVRSPPTSPPPDLPSIDAATAESTKEETRALSRRGARLCRALPPLLWILLPPPLRRLLHPPPLPWR